MLIPLIILFIVIYIQLKYFLSIIGINYGKEFYLILNKKLVKRLKMK
jgi:hypothetical protein